jgi:hypothetical protein
VIAVVNGKFYKVRNPQNLSGFEDGSWEWYNPISWFDSTDKFATDLLKTDRQLAIEQKNRKF